MLDNTLDGNQAVFRNTHFVHEYLWGRSMSVVNSPHIWLDDHGVAWIDRTNLKVIEVALERLAHGSSVEEIVDQHKGTLSFAQVHAALAHFYDFEEEFLAKIDEQLSKFDELRAATMTSPGRLRLKQRDRPQ
ncbi:MAG: DUF433 domain-containing protein [Planctomycetaceae bacterium]|nr:DUF433 domain-containing protein [Planctomycetaceae bacterium]